MLQALSSRMRTGSGKRPQGQKGVDGVGPKKPLRRKFVKLSLSDDDHAKLLRVAVMDRDNAANWAQRHVMEAVDARLAEPSKGPPARLGK